MDKHTENLRREYINQSFDITDVNADPIVQFKTWLDIAAQQVSGEVNVMTLATVDADGKPSARIVLLKGFDENGFRFYTNFNSRKGRELLVNPHAALLFYWHELAWQVRIEGGVSTVSDDLADDYFNSRPRGSQLGAHVSPQSEPIESRVVLDEALKKLQNQYANETPVPRPEHWGGFCLNPSAMEFWKGQPNRLHDRIHYTRKPDGSWAIERLAP